jgi:hypothetical protein
MIGFGLFVATMAGLAALQLGDGPMVLPLSQSDDGAAERTVVSDPARARVLTERALALRPVDAEAWLRLAQIEAARTKALKPAARLALSRSYDVGPYASAVLESRVRFAYEHWRELGADLQGQAISEVKAAWPVAPQKQRLLTTARRVDDPVGGVALSGLLLTLRLTDEADGAAQRAVQAATTKAAGHGGLER